MVRFAVRLFSAEKAQKDRSLTSFYGKYTAKIRKNYGLNKMLIRFN